METELFCVHFVYLEYGVGQSCKDHDLLNLANLSEILIAHHFHRGAHIYGAG